MTAFRLHIFAFRPVCPACYLPWPRAVHTESLVSLSARCVSFELTLLSLDMAHKQSHKQSEREQEGGWGNLLYQYTHGGAITQLIKDAIAGSWPLKFKHSLLAAFASFGSSKMLASFTGY